MNPAMIPSTYIYLHGFASSPQSAKAQALRDRFAQVGLPLLIPDLNQDDFFHLTLTRQLDQVAALLPPAPAPVTLIGSSLGGLTAAWLGERHPQVNRLVLLAPAFGFLHHWLRRLGADQVAQWQTTGSLAVYHYSAGTQLPLGYGFIADAARYDDALIRRPIPTLILHGTADDVIPLQASRDYVGDRPWARLIELESDHALGTVADDIWQATRQFCSLP